MSRIRACTIVTGSHIPFARVLATSFLAHHPESEFTVLLVDDEERELRPSAAIDERLRWWRLSDVGLDAAETHRLAAIYDGTELCTALKPRLLGTLVGLDESAVIYLDSDIRVFASLAHVLPLAERHGIVLTPHIGQSTPADEKEVDDLAILAAGAYNLGFCAVSSSSTSCLDWWWQKTRRHALSDSRRQMFTDQRWGDLVPSLFEHHLLKDAGHNVAYWNLHERPLRREGRTLYARGAVLRFFHFSGFSPRSPWLLSRHQGDTPRFLLSEHPLLRELCEDYATALDAAGCAAAAGRPFRWEKSADGLPMSTRIRRAYRSALMAAERSGEQEPPDPFDAASPGAFTEWLNLPSGGGSGTWSRYVRAVYEDRPDVKAVMPHIDGVDGPRFMSWLHVEGTAEEQIPRALLPAVPPEGEGPKAPPAVQGRATSEGVNITGLFDAELGVGEAARLLAQAVAAAGIPYRTSAYEKTRSRRRHAFEAQVSETPFDVNIVCLNADLTPSFARSVGPGFFEGRYTIGYWFWEVDPLPEAMRPAFDAVDEVWTASDYVRRILHAATDDKPVLTIPLPFLAHSLGRPSTREELGLPAGRFVFLFVFDFMSGMERKNPIGLIEAFRAAFRPGDGAFLLIKCINGHLFVGDLERLRLLSAAHPDIEIRDGYANVPEKNALFAACDCYVSLHRAEGLGLTIAEAMTFGRPAIATGYSGNLQFMTRENSFLVDCERAHPSDQEPHYPRESWWVEPSVSHAAQLMRAVFENREEAARRGEHGRADVLGRHGLTASASAVSSRLAEIRRIREAARHQGGPVAELTLRSLRWLTRVGRRAAYRILRPKVANDVGRAR